nr:unnamed protein product [Digitaria exilis]
MSTCGYHSPRFSEVAHHLPLPRYCLAPTMASAASALDGWRRPESFYERSVAFMSGDPSQEHQSATINAAGYSGFILHLSGDEETAASTPISSNVLPFSLHLSSESAAESSPAEHNDNTQVPNYGTPKVPSEGSFLDGQEQEVNFVCQNQFEAKDPQPDNQTGVCKVTGKAISMQFDANKHKRHDVSGGKVDVRKLRNADVNDAIELSIAASEAMVIAEMILDDSQSDKLAAAAIEAALHVKEARKQFYCEETEHACGSSENDLDETDWLAELDEAEMVDVFQDVGLPLVHVSCSSQGQYTGDLKQQNSHPNSPPCVADTHILGSCSSEKQNNRWDIKNADSDDHVSDSFPANQSAGVLPNESTPCPDFVKQAALGKTFSCSRNKKTVLQASTENNAALHGALGALVTCQSIHKEVGRVAAQMNAGTKKHVKGAGGRIEKKLETREYIDYKEAILQGVDFMLTGFPNQKEKEIESLIRKCGGYVLSKVPPFPLDKTNSIAESSSWKPPIVLSPKKVSTAKFLYGCAINAWVLNPNWFFDSLQAGVLLPPGKYLIQRRNAQKHSSAFGHSVHPKCRTLIFDRVGFLIHGKISFCSKFSNITKHGGGQVFVSLQGLVESLKDGSASHGIILVASEASASRHLSHCGLEHDIKTAPASWIIASLFSGKLIPLKKDRCASFRRIKMPSFHQQHVIYDMSQEI